MINVTFAQIENWMMLFFWPFIRISSFVLSAPLFGHSSVPARVKIGFSIFLTGLISSILPPLPTVAFLSWESLGVITEQIIIGLAMGLTLHVMFTVVQAAGEFIGLQMGLAFATFYTPDSGNTMILSRLLYMLTLLMFLAFNGHLIVIEILANTFISLPIGFGSLNANGFDMLVRYASTIFISGLSLALPLIAALLIINLGMGILNRAAPQFTVFSIGFPMSLTLGIFLLALLMNDLSRFLEKLFDIGVGFLGSLPGLFASH